MPPSSTSRLPVEIWQRILRFVILGLYILNPDPYEVPSSLSLNIPFYTDMPKESYKDYVTQVANLRRVCKSWNSFSISLLDLVVPLTKWSGYLQNTANADVERLSRAIKITQRPYPPICRCRFGLFCQHCWTQSAPLAPAIHKITVPFRAEIMDVMDSNTLQFLLNSPERFPRLISVNLVYGIASLTSLLPTFFARFPTLVLLRIWGHKVDGVNVPLDLRNLQSLEIWAVGELSFRGWKLPSLRSFIYEVNPSIIENITDSLKEIAPNLTLLSLPFRSSFDSSRPSDIWEKLPNLVILSCPISFLLANLPPYSHPLQQFRVFEAYDGLSRVQQEQLIKAMENKSNLRSIMGDFDWSNDFKRVMACIRDKEPVRTASKRRSRLSLGLELQNLGVKYQDMYGIDFTEACGRFGGAFPMLSIQEYLSNVTARV